MPARALLRRGGAAACRRRRRAAQSPCPCSAMAGRQQHDAMDRTGSSAASVAQRQLEVRLPALARFSEESAAAAAGDGPRSPMGGVTRTLKEQLSRNEASKAGPGMSFADARG